MELWNSDGTAGGTALLKDLRPGYYVSLPDELTNVNGTLFFAADDGADVGLWKSAWSESGTTKLHSSGGWYRELTDVNGTLYFRGYDGTTGNELWKSDGTPESGEALWKSDGTEAGTVFVSDAAVGYSQLLAV